VETRELTKREKAVSRGEQNQTESASLSQEAEPDVGMRVVSADEGDSEDTRDKKNKVRTLNEFRHHPRAAAR
jgi:hypothetical protein